LAASIHWLCHAPTKAMRAAAFPAADDRPDDAGLRKARAAIDHAIRHDRAVASPAIAAVETAAAMALVATAEPALRDVDHGRWAGRSILEVQAGEPDLLAAWIADPSRTTPGGEPLADVMARVGAWMDQQSRTAEAIIAITHPAIIRAAIAVALRCPPACMFAIDILPLSRTTMSFNGKWRLQGLNVAL